MEYSNKEIKVGLMLVIGFSLIVLFLVAIFGVSWTDNTKEYTTYLKSIPGIASGSLVKFGGMDVGFVSEIALPPPDDLDAKICVRLKIDDRTPVRENSLA